MEESEYWEGEKVLYKTSGKARIQHENPREATILITEGHVVIEMEELINIPLSHIQVCTTSFNTIPYTYSNQPQRPFSSTTTLTFTDKLNRYYRIDLEIPLIEVDNFKEAIDKKIKQVTSDKWSDDMVHPFTWAHAWISQQWIEATKV